MTNQPCSWLCDTWTVIQKDLRDLYAATTTNSVLRALWLGLAAIVGTLAPWWMGHDWLDLPMMIVVWLVVPIPLVIAGVAESIAGERERHTLEPLLATRLPIRAILTGKILAATAFGWLGSVAIMFIGLVVVNLAEPGHILRLHIPAMGVSGLSLGLLTAFFTACAGVSVSINASTVRRARMTISKLLLGLMATGAVVGATLTRLNFPVVSQEHIGTLTVPGLAVAGAILLLLLDTGLFIFAAQQFRRTRLITE